jgi:hypothetical protein
VPEGISNIQVIEFGIWVPLPDGGGLIIVADVQESEVEGYSRSIAFIGTGVGCSALDCEVGF